MKRLRIWESEIYLIEAGKGKERKGKEREGKGTLGYTSEPHACYFLTFLMISYDLYEI